LRPERKRIKEDKKGRTKQETNPPPPKRRETPPTVQANTPQALLQRSQTLKVMHQTKISLKKTY